MFISTIIASVNRFNQGSTDKNGKEPVILNVVSGKCPNRNVISGTVAESMGIEVGKTYLFHVREGEPDAQYGRRFVFSSLKEMSALEIIQGQALLGASEVFDVAEQAGKTVEANKNFHEANR